MNHPKLQTGLSGLLVSKAPLEVLGACFLLGLGLIQSSAQGTMTFTFDGQPPGTIQQYGYYTEAGMQFGMAYGPGSIYRVGSGNAGYADNGTSYLGMPDGIPGGNGDTRFEFGYNAFPPTSPLIPFNLISFDAAEYDGFGPQTLTVVGYKTQIMGPTLMVTNSFSVNSLIFQTFNLDSSFANVFKVDVFNARWSVDNVVINGVPEPSCSALAIVSAGCGLFATLFRSKSRKLDPIIHP